jgi:hypothetical protein
LNSERQRSKKMRGDCGENQKSLFDKIVRVSDLEKW